MFVILELLAPAKLPAQPTLSTQNKALAPARSPATLQIIAFGLLCQGIPNAATPAPARPANPAKPARPAKPATLQMLRVGADALDFLLEKKGQPAKVSGLV